MFRTWVYHPTKEAKIVMSDEAEELYKQGWSDTPVESTEEGAEVEKGDTELNELTKAELEEYAKAMFDVDLDRRKRKETLIAEIEALEQK